MERPTYVAKLDAGSFPLDEIVDMVASGHIRIPDFQRNFRWTHQDVVRLFDSIYRGYPVGTLLFWKQPAKAGSVEFAGATWEVPGYETANWVVDGQQRITSLALSVDEALGANVADRRFNIFFDLVEEQFVSLPPGQASAPDWLPLFVAFDLSRVLEWSSELGLDKEQRERAFTLTKRLRNYHVPAYIVTTDDENAVREIFDRMNTFGKGMSRAEVFEALHSSISPDGDLRLASIADTSAALGFGSIPDAQVLHLILATRSSSDVLRDFRNEFVDQTDKATTFKDTKVALAQAIGFMQGQAAMPHASLVPYQHLLVVLVRFFHYHANPEPRVVVLLRRWFWRAAIAGPHRKGGTTGTLRANVAAVNGVDPYSDIAGLMDLTKGASRSVELPKTLRRSNADMRIALAAMYSLAPHSASTDEAYAAEQLFEVNSFQHLLSPTRVIDSSGLENVLLIPADGHARSAIETVLISGDPRHEDLRASHAISNRLIQLVQEGRFDDALKERRSVLDDLVRRFVASRAEWDASDRPSIQAILGAASDG